MFVKNVHIFLFKKKKTNRQTDTQTDRLMERGERDGQTDRLRKRGERDGRTDRLRERGETDRQREGGQRDG